MVDVVGNDVLLLPASSFALFRGGLLCLDGVTVLHIDGSTEVIKATTAMVGDGFVVVPAPSTDCLGAGVIGMKAGQTDHRKFDLPLAKGSIGSET